MRLSASLARAVPANALDERDRLVMGHVSLVKALAHRLLQRLPSQVEINDLVSAGILGLMDAAAKYESSLGVPFDAYARRRVQGAMIDSLRALDWAPRSLRRLQRDLDRAVTSLRQRLRREPEADEIAAEMGLSPRDYARALEQVRALEVGSLRQLEAETSDGSLLELCIDPEEGIVAKLERQELRKHLARALTELPERERHVLALYYEKDLTLGEIGEVIGVGESRVCQLRSIAISRLRTSLRSALVLAEVSQ